MSQYIFLQVLWHIIQISDFVANNYVSNNPVSHDCCSQHVNVRPYMYFVESEVMRSFKFYNSPASGIYSLLLVCHSIFDDSKGFVVINGLFIVIIHILLAWNQGLLVETYHQIEINRYIIAKTQQHSFCMFSFTINFKTINFLHNSQRSCFSHSTRNNTQPIHNKQQNESLLLSCLKRYY